MHLQTVEGVRPDVRIINLSLASADWFIRQLLRRDPAFPLTLSEAERTALLWKQWPDSTLVVSTDDGSAPATTVTLTPRPRYGDQLVLSDVVLIDLVRTNRWRDPITFAITTGENGTGWLSAFARLDGVYSNVLPTRNPSVDRATLRANLPGAL